MESLSEKVDKFQGVTGHMLPYMCVKSHMPSPLPFLLRWGDDLADPLMEVGKYVIAVRFLVSVFLYAAGEIFLACPARVGNN